MLLQTSVFNHYKGGDLKAKREERYTCGVTYEIVKVDLVLDTDYYRGYI